MHSPPSHSLLNTLVNFHKTVSILIIGLMLTACSQVPENYAASTTTPADREMYHAEIFDSARRLVSKHYFDPTFNGLDWQAVSDKYKQNAVNSQSRDELYREINAMFSELDKSHLHAIPPDGMRQVRSGTYQGFGMQLMQLEGQIVVQGVFSGSPAEAAGVKPGWILVSVNGIEVPQAFSQISIVPDQSYIHKFAGEDNQFWEIPLAVQSVNRQERISKLIEDDVAYIRFDQFTPDNIKWLNSELKASIAVPSVILDLRNNIGGDELSMRRAIREFFQEKVVRSGIVVSSGGKQKSLFAAYPFTAKYSGSVYVLTSERSASSTEIFAHVLQSYGRATVIGGKTSGQVLGSKYFRLPDSGYLQIPIRTYIGLDGKHLEGNGVIPDIEIPRSSLSELTNGEDLVLEKAIELAMGARQ